MNQILFQRLEEKIFELRPQLKIIRDTYGHLSYFDYAKQKNRASQHKLAKERKSELIEVVKQETTRLLGSAIAESVEKQLKKNDSISTTEHTASIGATNILHAALHSSVPLFGNDDPRMKNILVFSCSGISFNNTVSFSRGMQFHGFTDNQIHDNQLTFFGRSADSQTVLYAPAYTHDTVAEMHKRLLSLVQEGKVQQEYAKTLDKLLVKRLSSPHALSMTEYVDQLTITNYYLWKTFFPSWNYTAIPNYIQLSQEKIVLKLILDYHLENDTLIHNLLFNPEYHTLIEKHFEGIFGAFKKDKSYGTFLFWGLSKDNVRFQLFHDGNALVNEEKNYSLELTPESLKEAIKNKEVFPSLLLTFTVLCFYYGLLAGGGPNQPDYLMQMKDAYIRVLTELNNTEEAENVATVATNDFIFNRSHLALIDAYGERIPAGGLDMDLYQNPEAWKDIIEATKAIPMGDLMNVILLTYYKLYCPQEERDEELMNESLHGMLAFLGIDSKMPPVGIIT